MAELPVGKKNCIDLCAAHIPGEENILADALSRRKVIATKWTLHHEVVQKIFALTDRPHIDLFASAKNARLPVNCTRYPHPQAWATDALQIDWNNMFAYAFPPISLLPKVINQNRAGTVPCPPQCPALASPGMVSETGQAADSDPTDPAPQAGHHLTTTVRDRTPETTGPSFDLLASLQRYFQTAGLSKDAADMAA